MEEREERLLKQLAKKGTSKDFFQVWMKEDADLVQHLAKAFSERFVFEQINELCISEEKEKLSEVQVVGIHSACPANREVLRKLRDLFVLDCIEKDLAWFMTQQLIPHFMSVGLNDRLNVLCMPGEEGIADESLALIESFGIPSQILSYSPIADDWIQFNQ